MRRPPNERRSLTIALWLVSLTFLVAANVFAVEFVGREKYVYYWDLANYWGKVARLREEFATAPSRAIRDVIYSVGHDDYNDLPAVLLLPGTFALGNSRLGYILAIVNILLVPAAVSCAVLHLASRRVSEQTSSPLIPLVSAGVVFLSPSVWTPVLRGYPDVGGVVLLNIVLLLYLRSSTADERKYDAVAIALLIPLAVLFRRWYAFWAVTFYGALFVERCTSLYLGRLREYRKVLLTLFTQGAISAAVLLVVAPSFAIKSATTSYSDLYSAYRFSASLWISFGRVGDYLGFLWLALFLVGAAQLAFDKATRHIAILLLVQWGAILFVFSRTQDFGEQHFYLLLPTMLLCSAVCITRVFMRSRTVALAIGVLLILNVVSTFASREVWFRAPAAHIFSGTRQAPLVRGDMAEVVRMLSVLREELTHRDDRVYVLASSRVLNSGMLAQADLSLDAYKDISARVLQTHDVDRRDGFPRRLLEAEYVIVTNPIQYHLRERDQRVVGIPAELVLSGRDMGAAFVRLPYEFLLDLEVKGYLYRKVRPLRDTDVSLLSDSLRRYYPDRPSIYETGR